MFRNALAMASPVIVGIRPSNCPTFSPALIGGHRIFKSSWSNPTASGFLPETVVRIGGKDRLLFRSGEVVQLSVPWLLNEMGIDLDTDECIDQASLSRSTKYRGGETDANNEGRCPRGRVSGAKFKLLFSYYNYNKQHQSSFSIPGSGETPAAAVVDIEATLQWTELQNAKTWVSHTVT